MTKTGMGDNYSTNMVSNGVKTSNDHFDPTNVVKSVVVPSSFDNITLCNSEKHIAIREADCFPPPNEVAHLHVSSTDPSKLSIVPPLNKKLSSGVYDSLDCKKVQESDTESSIIFLLSNQTVDKQKINVENTEGGCTSNCDMAMLSNKLQYSDVEKRGIGDKEKFEENMYEEQDCLKRCYKPRNNASCEHGKMIEISIGDVSYQAKCLETLESVDASSDIPKFITIPSFSNSKELNAGNKGEENDSVSTKFESDGSLSSSGITRDNEAERKITNIVIAARDAAESRTNQDIEEDAKIEQIINESRQKIADCFREANRIMNESIDDV